MVSSDGSNTAVVAIAKQFIAGTAKHLSGATSVAFLGGSYTATDLTTKLQLERIRQPSHGANDRDCSIFQEALSIGRRRCLYLRRWTSRTSSGRRFERASPSRSVRARRVAEGDRGETLAMFSTGFCGSFAPELRGPTCRGGIRRRRPVMIASRSGSAKGCWTKP